MPYAEIDPVIEAWANRHALRLHRQFAGYAVRSAYVSSTGCETFQIWIEEPCDGFVALHADAVEGRREDEPPRNWRVSIADLETTLEQVFSVVLTWMRPFPRFFPESAQRTCD